MGIHEKHHILPNSFGGTITIPLTYRQHYIAHLLLTKFTQNKDKMKMCFSLHTFFHFDKHRELTIPKSLIYEMHKKNYSISCSIRGSKIDATIYHYRNMKTNDIFTGTRSDFGKYSGLTPQEIQFLQDSHKNRIRHIKQWGIFIPSLNIFSYEKKRLNGIVGNKVCEHCNSIVSLGNYSRWHGKNCKTIDPIGHLDRSKHTRQLRSQRK